MTTDAEQLAAVFLELRSILLDVGDLAQHIVLVGGQVITAESLAAGGSGAIQVDTETEVYLNRGYSFEPDLLIDFDNAPNVSEVLPEVLRQHGFEKSRSYRWMRKNSSGTMLIDIFQPEDSQSENVSVSATPLPESEAALARATAIEVPVSDKIMTIRVPDPIGFMAMKLRAKEELRPDATKDSFDLLAYAYLKTPAVIKRALDNAGQEGDAIRNRLRALFEGIHRPGVRDVLTVLGSSDDRERELVARFVVDLFVSI
jgi:hypothetical protein